MGILSDSIQACVYSIVIPMVFIGSVVAFGSYLTLIGRIGPGRAAYATVSFPVVAIIVSVLFEGYELSLAAVMLGNWLALSKPRAQNPLASPKWMTILRLH